jgi:phosphinothricin acetyltransferase
MDLRQLTALRERLVVQGYPCLVAEAGAGGTVLGFAFAAPFATRAAWRGTVEGGVCVRPDAAGRGVGRALLAGLIAACEAKGFRQMVAVLGGTAEEGGASLALHRALGFEQAGVLSGVGLHQGEPVDSVLMQRALGGAAKRAGAAAAAAA